MKFVRKILPQLSRLLLQQFLFTFLTVSRAQSRKLYSKMLVGSVKKGHYNIESPFSNPHTSHSVCQEEPVNKDHRSSNWPNKRIVVSLARHQSHPAIKNNCIFNPFGLNSFFRDDGAFNQNLLFQVEFFHSLEFFSFSTAQSLGESGSGHRELQKNSLLG